MINVNPTAKQSDLEVHHHRAPSRVQQAPEEASCGNTWFRTLVIFRFTFTRCGKCCLVSCIVPLLFYPRKERSRLRWVRSASGTGWAKLPRDDL